MQSKCEAHIVKRNNSCHIRIVMSGLILKKTQNLWDQGMMDHQKMKVTECSQHIITRAGSGSSYTWCFPE